MIKNCLVMSLSLLIGLPQIMIGQDNKTSPTASIVADLKTILNQKSDIPATLIALKLLADDAKSKGAQAPKYNLCDIVIPNSNLFCQRNIHIPRKDMPQLGGSFKKGSKAEQLVKQGVLKINEFGGVDLVPEFIEYLKKQYPDDPNIVSGPQFVLAADLKAAQNEIVGSKVADLWWLLEKNSNWKKEQVEQCRAGGAGDVVSSTSGITAPIMISKDRYILDGHHRWAAIVGSNFLGDVKMCAIIIDLPIDQLLKVADQYAQEDMGIEREAGL